MPVSTHRARQRDFEAPATAPSKRVRRLGSAIPLAFSYACGRNDLGVTAQLLDDYEVANTDLPITRNEDRRDKFKNFGAAHA